MGINSYEYKYPKLQHKTQTRVVMTVYTKPYIEYIGIKVFDFNLVQIFLSAYNSSF